MISQIVTLATTTFNISNFAAATSEPNATVNYFTSTFPVHPGLLDGSGNSAIYNSTYNTTYNSTEYSTLYNASTYNASYNATFSVPIFPSYIKTISMVLCIIIMCLGVIGNVMVPIVIFKTKDMRNSTNIFLVNLSIADLMVLLVCTPTVLVEVNSKPETWVLGREMCGLF